jgi:hypothetical protein
MVRILKEKPEIYSVLHNDHLFYELYDENGVYGYAALDFCWLPNCYLHLEISRFSPGIYENLVEDDWPEAQRIMVKHGASRVIVNHRSNDKDALFSKFVQKFGFSEPIKYITSYQEINNG